MKFLFAVIVSALIFISLDKVGQSLPLDPVSTSEQLSQMNIFQAVILGMVQGLTEFLPISSTAHLKIVPVALGWGDPGVAFTAVIQLGSIFSVVWYFWQDLTKIVIGAYKSIVTSDYQSPDFRMAVGIALGSIPIIFFGLLIKIFIPDFDNSALRSTVAIAIASIVMALLLGIAEKIGSRKRNFEQLDIKDGILMGLAQALALVPGVSRSGSTITGGLFMGLERATAAKFSFLLGLPAITLAGLVELKTLLDEGFGGVGLVPTIAGIISAIIFSYIAIAWLIKYLQTQDTWIFVWYRLAFGVLILVAIAGGVMQNN
ncbi:MAG: undecaprenyl-diphosphate phosphatase [Okeania sp. SIO2D1]|uniref:undecaprenyl-diphosphate phosphatase n=1 Tax=Okeania sp. SIO2C9 TaxID=2607791 RepID=UPI0013BDAEC7|nr:undecaprenyl-diphosphate phosphatase [Okeania sp. SIO2C9]NES70557.1 undecaprenyl-diphosphate phosphatase [Okeania sp. SIO2D1]